MQHQNSPGVVALLYCEVEERLKEASDVASDDPPDEALSCRRRAWDVPWEKLESGSGVFPENFRNSSGKSEPHWFYGPLLILGTG